MDRESLLRWWPLAAVVALLSAAVLSAAHSAPQLDRVPRSGVSQEPPQLTSPEEQSPPPTPPSLDGEGIGIPGWLPTLFGALLIALVLAVVLAIGWFLVRDLFRRRDDDADGGEPAEGRASGEEVIAAVDAGLADLSDTDRDPRRAVIACWLRLEETAGAAGLPRQVGDTSTDLVTRLLRGGTAAPGAAPDSTMGAPAVAGVPTPGTPGGDPTRAAGDGDPTRAAVDGDPTRAAVGGDPTGVVVSADVLAGFAAVYRAARYATHDVDESMRAQALTALSRLRAELTGQAVR